jgi:two-component system, sensor histidine kinase and response regulator
METVLIIEDDSLLREEIAQWLRLENFDVHVAATGTQGLALAQALKPALAISDITMPGMDGYALLAEIRARPETAAMPFIFLTARAERGDIRQGMALGATDYITKPFTSQELLTAVRTNLHKRADVNATANADLEQLLQHLTRTLPHELRTPLHGIIGFADLIVHDAELAPEEVSEAAQFIGASAARLQHLVENYLNYVHLQTLAADGEAGFAQSHCSTDVAAIVAAACREVADAAHRSDELRLDLVAGQVAVQPEDLHKIVVEIAGNAFKFSLPGQPVTVSGTPDVHRYWLTIGDRGRGMTPRQARSIGAFTQFDREIYEQQGAGLGAAIAARIATLYGGTFDIESTPGTGTQVRIGLPACSERR